MASLNSSRRTSVMGISTLAPTDVSYTLSSPTRTRAGATHLARQPLEVDGDLAVKFVASLHNHRHCDRSATTNARCGQRRLLLLLLIRRRCRGINDHPKIGLRLTNHQSIDERRIFA